MGLRRDFGACDFGASVLLVVDWAGLACGFGAVALLVVDGAVLARDFGAVVLLVVDWAVLACVVLVALLLAAADD